MDVCVCVRVCVLRVCKQLSVRACLCVQEQCCVAVTAIA